MKIVKSLFTFFIVIILGVVVYFQIYKVEQNKKILELQEKKLVRFNLDRIQEFKFNKPDSTIVFERGIGRIWNITAPIIAEADKKPIYQLFLSLDQSDILFTVEENPADLSVYGLSSPDYYLSMTYDQSDPDTLFIGSDTPDGTMSYVRFASEKRVNVVTKQLTGLFTLPANSYRSRTILNVLDDDIMGFDIVREDTKYGENELKLIRTGKSWMMSSPWELVGDNKNIETLATAISETNKLALVEEKTGDFSQYGLDDPQMMVNVSLRYGMPDKLIIIGNNAKATEDKNVWYAKLFDNDLIFTIPNSLVTLINRPPHWFIDKQPTSFDRNLVNRIVMKTNQEPITIFRDTQNNWAVTSPVDQNVSDTSINSIFGISRFALVSRLFSYAPGQEEMVEAGLDNPNIVISFYNNDLLLMEISFGTSFMTNAQNTYFKTHLSPIIYITTSEINSVINKFLSEVFES